MDKKQKALSEAYDKVYDLNSLFRFKFDEILDKLKAEAQKQGFIFELNQKTQKWNCKKISEV